MDPNTTYRSWMESSDSTEKRVYAEQLLSWLSIGGDRPRWTDEQRGWFYDWCSWKGMGV